MLFSEKEFNVFSDTDFLLTKVEVIAKMKQLLTDTREELRKRADDTGFSFPYNIDRDEGKISKGENYLGLPYLVLDYPACFSNEDIFAFRTMFWWGNFFSCTLHLQGRSLELYRRFLINNFDKLKKKGLYVSIGKTPWHYHYGSDNYVLATEVDESNIIHADFIKLSKRIELTKWERLPNLAASFLTTLLSSITEPL